MPSNTDAPCIWLEAADARLDEEFTSIDYLRELSDRRVLVVDTREKRLVVANFAKGTVETLSRTGSGLVRLHPLRLFSDSLAIPRCLLDDWPTAGCC